MLITTAKSALNIQILKEQCAGEHTVKEGCRGASWSSDRSSLT